MIWFLYMLGCASRSTYLKIVHHFLSTWSVVSLVKFSVKSPWRFGSDKNVIVLHWIINSSALNADILPPPFFPISRCIAYCVTFTNINCSQPNSFCINLHFSIYPPTFPDSEVCNTQFTFSVQKYQYRLNAWWFINSFLPNSHNMLEKVSTHFPKFWNSMKNTTLNAW